MKKDHANHLFDNYWEGKTSAEENALIEDHILSQRPNAENTLSEKEFNQHLGTITSKMNKLVRKPVIIRPWISISAVAAVLVIVSMNIYFRRPDIFDHRVQAVESGSIILPGGNTAILHLESGQQINLSDIKNGEIARAEGVVVTKTYDGLVEFNITASPNPRGSQLNSIITPKGGQYMIRLPDGSKVWLNAASTLSFPTTFDVTRNVELSGEAYFEIAKDKTHPFIVKTKKQEVTVLGTHFNISSYDDDPDVETTLLEGSVKVASRQNSITLLPGEKSIIRGAKMLVSKANLEDDLDWKNGYFILDNETFRGAMAKIARWYNVELTYETNPDNINIGGMVPRSAKINEILALMGQTGEVHFKIEGRRITIIR